MDYTKLFTLCGYDERELAEQSPRIDKAFQRLGIEEEDVRRAEDRIEEHYAVEFQGIRKLLGVWMKEAIHLVLARDEKRKVIYSEWPGAGNVINMGGVHAYPDCYFGTPGSQTMNTVMGCIFDKLTPIMEAGEANGLPAGMSHCALWQTHVGLLVKKMIPEPDLIVQSGWLCDQAAESGQLVHDLFGIPTIYLDGCLDWQWGDEEIGTQQVKYSASKARKVKEKIEEIVGAPMDDASLQAGFWDMGKTFFNFQSLLQLMGKADPQPISQANLDLIYMMFFTVLQHREEANQAIVSLIPEVKKLVDEGKGVVPKGSPRVYSSIRCAVDPAIAKMLEDAGLSIPCCLADYLVPGSMEKIQSQDPFELMCEGVLRLGGPMQGAYGAVRYMINCCKDFKVDGALLGFPWSCRMTSSAYLSRDMMRKELGIPVMSLEWDGYDTRQYSAGQLRTRVESFAEIVRMNKAAKAG